MTRKFSNISDLVKDIERRVASGDKTIMNQLKNSKGESYEVVTEREIGEAAEQLKEYLKKSMQAYFGSYEPTRYDREEYKDAFVNSIKVKVFDKDGIRQAVVYFEDEGAIRNSFMADQPRGYLPALLNDGWKVTSPNMSDEFKAREHLGWYDGFHFIEMAVAEAERDPKFKNVEIVVNKDVPWGKL